MGFFAARSRSVARSGIRPTNQKSSENVPDERAAELRPQTHGAGIRKHVIGHPGTPGMDERKDAGAGHREERHGFGEAVDRGAPLLIQQEKNSGDQRAGMADTDPPDEIDDGESPADRNVDAPNSDALDD